MDHEIPPHCGCRDDLFHFLELFIIGDTTTGNQCSPLGNPWYPDYADFLISSCNIATADY